MPAVRDTSSALIAAPAEVVARTRADESSQRYDETLISDPATVRITAAAIDIDLSPVDLGAGLPEILFELR